ncbi:helix-turn-helix transcriptional regulator [Orrella sp. JC864]|uniref:helix-turn-helix transcriptional regulator n=1 Tax=Orrella sp. JC864 TaxID=3120298 RepID=UPI00142905E1
MLPHRLKQARLRLGVSQEKLGRLVDIDPASASARMNQYERGKHTPDYSLVKRLAPVLGLPVPWFYTEDDETAELLELFHRMHPSDRVVLLNAARRLVPGLGR